MAEKKSTAKKNKTKKKKPTPAQLEALKKAREAKKKKAEKKGTSKKTEKKKPEEKKDTEKVLIENFISLQKVMVNLSSKFDELSEKMSKLLEIFEISAKSLAEKDFDKEQEKENTEEILNRMNDLSEQNRLIAKGITLMHENNQGKNKTNFPKPFPTKKVTNHQTSQNQSNQSEENKLPAFPKEEKELPRFNKRELPNLPKKENQGDLPERQTANETENSNENEQDESEFYEESSEDSGNMFDHEEPSNKTQSLDSGGYKKSISVERGNVGITPDEDEE